MQLSTQFVVAGYNLLHTTLQDNWYSISKFYVFENMKATENPKFLNFFISKIWITLSQLFFLHLFENYLIEFSE